MFSADRLFETKAPLLPFLSCLIVGIVIGNSWPVYPFIILLYSLFAALVALTLITGKKPQLQSLLIYSCTLLLGMLLTMRSTQQSDRLIDKEERLLEAVVASEPTEKNKTMAVEVVLCESGESVTCYLWKDERSRSLTPGDGLLIKTRMEQGWHHTLRCYVSARKWQKSDIALKRLSLIDRTRIRFLKWRHSLLIKYRLQGATDDAYAVLAAMTLGDKSALSKQLKDTYSITGASHVLALSGLHLSILYLLLTGLTFTRRRRRIWSQVLVVLSIWSFALLVGLPVSVVRSALMVSIFALFSLGERPHLSVNLLCLAACIILLITPLSLFDVGFQLSFMAVLSILLFIPIFQPENTLSTNRSWLSSVFLQPIYSCLAVSLAAQIGSAPLVAFYFGRFSTYFLLTNLVVIPAAYLILTGTLLILLIPAASTAVLWIINLLNSLLTYITKLPMASIEGLHPSVVQVVLYYLLIASLYGITYILTSARRR